MVLSVILLAISITLTLSRSAARLFDRLRMSFPAAIVLQLALLVTVILPHLKVSSRDPYALAAILGVITTVIIYSVYVFIVYRKHSVGYSLAISSLLALPAWLLGGGFFSAVLVAVGCLIGSLTARCFSEAFTSAILGAVISLCLAVMLFGSDFFVLAKDAVNAAVYSLFLVMPIFNIFVRRREVFLC